MFTLVSYFCQITFSRQFILWLFLIFSAIVWLAFLGSSFSGRQTSAVLLDFTFSFSRITFCVLGLLLLQSLLGRVIERKYIVQLIALPVPRWQIVSSCFVVISLPIFIGISSIAIAIAILEPTLVEHEQQVRPVFGWHYFLSWLTIFVDVLVVVAFGAFITSFSITSFLPLIAGLCFYVVAHGYSPMLDFVTVYAERGDDSYLLLQQVLNILKYFLVDLDALDIRYSVIYQLPLAGEKLVSSFMAAIMYLVFLLVLAALIFSKRDFN